MDRRMKQIEIEEKRPEFEEKVIQIDRVTRVVKGGRRLRFRAIVVVGDKNGKVGVACEKGGDVQTAIQKAVTKAKKEMKEIPLSKTTIPHSITSEYAGAKVFLKPARKGTGVIAGGAVRAVLEAAGVKDIFSKIQGSSSKLNNVYATMKALNNLIKLEVEKPKTKEAGDSEIKKEGKQEQKTVTKKKSVKENSDKKSAGEKDESSKSKKDKK